MSVYALVGRISGDDQRMMLPDDKQAALKESQHKQNTRH
jgi:hypothetical protein